MQDGFLQQLAVQGGHSIHSVRADGGQVRHPNILRAVFVNQRDTGEEIIVPGTFCPNFVEEAAIDFVDDLEMSGQQLGKERQGPLLESFGK